MMQARFTLLIALCLAAAGCDRGTPRTREPAWPQPDPARGVIGAYYYPWYDGARWSAQAATHTPKLGRYQSSDPNVAAQHIAWARQADLDFFMVSWIAPGRMEDENLKRTLLPEMEKARFHFAVMYETPLALGIPAGQLLDMAKMMPSATTAGHALIEHFDYLAAQYFKRDSYLRFEGRPVVMLYVVRDMTNGAPYLKLLRERMSRRGFDLYLIADVLYWNDLGKLDWPFLKEHFQAVTGYNMYDPPRAAGSNFLGLVQAQFEATDRVARENGLRLIPNAMPGYDDSPLRGRARPALPRSDGSFYRASWDMAAEFFDSRQPFLLITSFNEWHEGTEIEPSTEHGERYLNLTREHAAKMRQKLDQPGPDEARP
jgi:hypothetical protein